MNFNLTDEQVLLQDGLRRFLREQATPDVLSKATAGDAGHSSALWQGLVEMGVPMALFREDVGGLGGSGFDLSVVFEELGRAGAFEPLLESGILAGGLIAELATAKRQDLIDEIIAGRILVLAHGEPDSRYDLAHVQTVAERTEAGWLLIGRKSLVVGAPAADMAVVSARVSGGTNDRDGIALFMVPLNRPGIELRPYRLQGGGRAAEIMLDAVRVDDGERLGGEDEVFEALERVHARACAAQCAEAVGLMDGIRVLTVDYLRSRKQFGKPIGSFQALQHRMADMLIEIEQARSATINLCGHLEAPRAERERQVSAAKNLIGRVARLVVEESIQMHGGIGMTMEYALGHLARRLTMVDCRFGDADWHLERFVDLSAVVAA